ncbi:MAG: hypothetical protein HS126_01035 [Anaerolineales bacterium]|nr:hypothetical protein [Anaerolineales bacterium]
MPEKNDLTKAIHFKEDTTKPENRTNLALLSILQIAEIRDFVLNALQLPQESLIYPCPNIETEEFATSQRPDFVVRDFAGTTLGYIEIELGPENSTQINSYRSRFNVPVYSVVGKNSYTPRNLSLEEIYENVQHIQQNYSNSQQHVSLELFCTLVRYYVVDGNFRAFSIRSNLSDKMLNSTLVGMIYTHFGNEKILQADVGVIPGKIRLDTISEKGFSLRVYSTKTGPKGFSLMSRSGGREVVEFPSLTKLRKYFPYRQEACDHYAQLIAQFGARDVLNLPEAKRSRLSLNVVENNFKEIADAIAQLI